MNESFLELFARKQLVLKEALRGAKIDKKELETIYERRRSQVENFQVAKRKGDLFSCDFYA